MPRRRLVTVALRAKPNSVNCNTGGTMSENASLRSRRIWLNSLRTSARSRWPKTFCRVVFMRLCLELHVTHPSPCHEKENRPDEPNDCHFQANCGPPSALEQGITDDFDVIPPPYERR